MSFASWNRTYELGLPTVDQQHETMVRMIDDLWQAFQVKEEGLQIAQVVEFMNLYTRVHFAEEEHLMEVRGYPSREAHIACHRAFEAQVEEFLPRASTATRMLSMEVLEYMRTWILGHIQETDRAMAAWIKAHPEPEAGGPA